MNYVDLEAVAEWMSGQGLGEGPLQDVSSVTGGTQNVMLRFTRAGRTYVLRRGLLGTADRLVAYLRSHRIGFERRRVGVFDVLLLDRPVRPAEVPLVVFGGTAADGAS